MGMFVWHKGKIGFSIPSEAMTGLDYAVVNDDGDRFYTPNGFIYPITTAECNLAAILAGGTVLKPGEGWNDSTNCCKYVRIDHDGNLWHYCVWVNKNEHQYEIYEIPYAKGTSGVVTPQVKEREYMRGLLAGGASIEVINKAGPEHGIDFGTELKWTTMAHILKRLDSKL